VRLKIEVLGRFRVTVGEKEIAADAWRRERGAALVKLLAVSPGHRVHKEQVIEAFWPDLDVEAGGANLRKAVHFARRALGVHEAIELGEVVALAGDVEIDADRFVASKDPDLYGGELLPDDRYAEWLDEPRKRLHDQYMRVLRTGELWDRIIAVDPTDEEAQCAVMQAALDAGNRGEVIRRFQDLRERLRIDLGIGPRASTVAIYERALAAPAIAPVEVVDRVRAALAWGLIHLHGGEFAKAEAVAIETRTLALGAGLGREVGEASALLGLTAHMQGRWPELFRKEFAEFARGASAVASNVFDGNLCLAEFCLDGADGHGAMAGYARELLAVAEGAKSPAGRALATMILGQTEQLSGRLDEAERLLSTADQIHTELGAVAGRALALERLAQIAIARGDRATAGKHLATARPLTPATWLSPHLVLRMHALAVQLATTPDETIDAVRDGDRALASPAMCQPCSMSYRAASALALAEVGETEQIGRRLDEADRLAAMWRGGPWQAALWEARGALRKAQGFADRANAAFGEAAARFGELGRPLDQSRCAARLASQ
jgi:DNA-binding SARP family transcriptional activator